MNVGTLSFDGVTKTFAHRVGQALLFPFGRPRFQALKSVSFALRPGESLGLVGPNGAGKSTVLNMATGLMDPDEGRIEVHGRVVAILELGAGFHPDLTGAENLRINAAMLGLTRAQTEARAEAMVDFADVREFIREPMRTYSSGMVLRLAFSVAVNADADILLIDEIIGVGDQAFQQRALEKVHALRRASKTIVLATHSPDLLTSLCERALWLDRGQIRMLGDAREVLAAYLGKTSAATP